MHTARLASESVSVMFEKDDDERVFHCALVAARHHGLQPQQKGRFQRRRVFLTELGLIGCD